MEEKALRFMATFLTQKFALAVRKDESQAIKLKDNSCDERS